jgi:transposase
MFKNHLNGIVNALVSSFNNAMAERLNGKFKKLKLQVEGIENLKISEVLFYFFIVV